MSATLRDLDDKIADKLESLTIIPEGERSDYAIGSINTLTWLRQELGLSILREEAASGVTPDLTAHSPAETAERFDAPFIGLADDFPTFSAPNLFSAAPCLAEKTHQYEWHAPAENQKKCKHCGDVRPMRHGEKIAHRKLHKADQTPIWDRKRPAVKA